MGQEGAYQGMGRKRGRGTKGRLTRGLPGKRRRVRAGIGKGTVTTRKNRAEVRGYQEKHTGISRRQLV